MFSLCQADVELSALPKMVLPKITYAGGGEYG